MIVCEHCKQPGGTLVKTNTGYRHQMCLEQNLKTIVDAQGLPARRKPSLFIARIMPPELKDIHAPSR